MILTATQRIGGLPYWQLATGGVCRGLPILMVIPGRSSFGPFPDGRSLLSRTREHLQRSDGATIEIARFRPDRGLSDRERAGTTRIGTMTTSPTRARPSSGSSPTASADFARRTLSHGDDYLNRAELGATGVRIARLVGLYGDRDEWKPKAISSWRARGCFSSDRNDFPSTRGYLWG